MTQQPPQSDPQCEPPDMRYAPPSFGRLARRMSAWTSNLLATSLILLLGLTFGRQVLSWWRADSPQATSEEIADSVLGREAVGEPSVPHFLEIGERPIALSRTEFHGSATEVLSQLRALCREAVRDASFPPHEPGRAERDLLAELAMEKPVASAPGRWELYEKKGPVPLVAGMRLFGEPEDGQVAGISRRVVSWGLGVHVADERWMLFCISHRRALAESRSELPEIEIPPGAQRNLSLRAADREVLVNFQGRGLPGDWMDFYDRRFEHLGWKAADGQRSGTIWHARYSKPGVGRVDVHLIAGGGRRLRGMLSLAAE